MHKDCSTRTTTPYSLGCIPYSPATLVLVIASNPAVITGVINETFTLAFMHHINIINEAQLKLALMNIGVTLQTSKLIRQSDSLPKSPNIFLSYFLLILNLSDEIVWLSKYHNWQENVC